MKHILFVCTGNTCRSPMAEALLRKMAMERGVEVEARSAGVAAMDGMSMSRHAEAVLRDHDIDDRLMSKSLQAEAVNWSDLILTLTGGHKQHVIRSFPQAADKVFTLKEYAENDTDVLNDMAELDSLYATWEVKRSLGQHLSDEERERLIEIQQRMPSFDISDPFGGSREDYDLAAAEIRTAIERLLDKLESLHSS
ncbi:low molecular weight protein arginine phosphatase [Paenibacillus sp. KQZ6P-2]|uniref:Low molecular weight protein arginine phosphatase n=1 Tax=Paenibacillus mangrovi TaxID=2931978 RepID=A0A9X1WRW4_9BACL|nr:low molecular weight protein arginine phosphatase [Paenibacillus mangrovi]